MRKGFTLVELMIVIAIIALLSAIAIPSVMAAIRSGNERNASASLKTVAIAQADFRWNDRDNNGVLDFWTADIAGLCCTDTGGGPIRLIDVTVATADLMPGFYPTPVSAFGVLSAKAGYWYYSLNTNEQVAAAGGNGNYRQDTDGSGLEVHNLVRFAYAAVPESYGASGSKCYIIDENNTLFQRDFGGDVIQSAGLPPPMFTGLWNFSWPTDAERRDKWGKLD